MIKFSVLVVAAMVFVYPAPGTAEPTDRQAREALRDYSACVANHNPREAETVVLSLIPNDEIIRRHAALVEPTCLVPGGRLKMPGDYLRYGLAEALIRREFANGLPADIAQASPLPRYQYRDAAYRADAGKLLKPKEIAALEQSRQKALAFQALSILGECVARKAPDDALNLVLTKIGTTAETQAFAALDNALSACVTEGDKLSIDRAALRGTIAMNLYRLAKAPRIAPEAPAK